ncbi:MAG: hypothetical protein KatS3mg001_439 [Candidatus Pacearchaeota archaeon]|nr:MAG: hypothetical protein KatS3mg001_439 [Candidatus Pacearchaeota archaeon]
MDKIEKIKRVALIYYSRPEVQEAIFNFSKNREFIPKYFDIFGKRPDSLQYKGDIFEFVKKGATSFHCSQELWKNPLDLSTEKTEKELNEMRIGWDLVLDVDSKYFDYSKILAELIIEVLRFYGVNNFLLKFSGSKGFHIIIPWKAFPEELNGIKTKDMFPEWPRIITKFLIETTKPKLTERISKLLNLSKHVLDREAIKKVMPDLILVSSRHLFRAPYSLHEKTMLASVVINPEEIKNFDLKDANPLNLKIKKFNDFNQNVKEGEAKKLLIEALDFFKSENPDFSLEKNEKTEDFRKIKIEKLSEEILPPTIKKILQGMEDGRKRSLFILINFFRAIGLEKNEIENIIFEWNKRNKVPLKTGYIKAQLSWSYRNKIVPPPNYDKDYYLGIGIIPTEEEMRLKNPVNFVSRVVKSLNKNSKGSKRKSK